MKLKRRILRNLKEQWNEENVNSRTFFRRQKFQQALEKAIQWQRAIENEHIRINNYNYLGPHKWIICLLGSDIYPVDNFISTHQ